VPSANKSPQYWELADETSPKVVFTGPFEQNHVTGWISKRTGRGGAAIPQIELSPTSAIASGFACGSIAGNGANIPRPVSVFIGTLPRDFPKQPKSTQEIQRFLTEKLQLSKAQVTVQGSSCI
jgi:hypothetical protein